MRRAFAQIKHHPSRFGALLLAIAISVGFVTTTLVFVETESGSIRDQVAAPARAADVVISPGELPYEDEAALEDVADLKPKLAQEIAATDGVGEVAVVPTQYATVGGRPIELTPVVSDGLQWRKLAEGAWPRTADEMAIDAALADEIGAQVGDTISMTIWRADSEPEQFRISGILTSSTSLLSGVNYTGTLAAESLVDLEFASDVIWLVDAAPGTDIDALVAQLNAMLDGHEGWFVAQTSDTFATTLVNDLSNGVDVFRTILLVFGAIALVVGMLIIANTFTILIAQRRRQIGMLRAVGASIGQVRRELLVEAILLGTIGSVLGLIGGIGLGAIAATVTGSIHSGLAIPWTIAVAFLVGVVITVLAAWLPSLRTSRIRPMEALRAAATDDARLHPGMITTIVSCLLVTGGIALLALAVTADGNQTLLAVGSAALLALGVLLGAGWFVPALVKLLGLAPARIGPTPRLAVANAVRNPKRATATCLALMLAVGLVTTLQVGTASVKQSTEAGINDAYPVPLILDAGDVSDTLVDQVREVQGITGAATLWQGTLGLFGEEYTVSGIGSDVDQVIPGLSIAADELLVDPNMALAQGLEDGDTIEATTPAGTTITLTVRVHKAAAYGLPVANLDSLRTWNDGEVVPSRVWATLDSRDTDDARQVMEDVQAIAPDAYLSGSIVESTLLTQILDILLLVATGLLGAAVLIALIGVGNTLGLSVLERTRESGLLRALGLQRAQLRGTLAIEAVLLALAGALVGIVAGIGFGWFGTWAVMAEMEETAVLQIPWGLIGIDAAIAVCAGILASVLPARRAVSVPPTVALADV